MSRSGVDSSIDGQPASRHAPSLHTSLEMSATHPSSSEPWVLHIQQQESRGGHFVTRGHESQAYRVTPTPPAGVRASASSSSSSGGTARTTTYDHQHDHARCQQLSSLPQTPGAVGGGCNVYRNTSGEEPHRARDDRYSYDRHGYGGDDSNYSHRYGAGPPVAGVTKERRLRDDRVALKSHHSASHHSHSAMTSPSIAARCVSPSRSSPSSSWHAWHQSSQTPTYPHPHDPAVRMRAGDSSAKFAVTMGETAAPKESHEQGVGLTSRAYTHTDLRPSRFSAFARKTEAAAFSALTSSDNSRNKNCDAGAGLDRDATRARVGAYAGRARDRASVSADAWRSSDSGDCKEVGCSAGNGRVGPGKMGHPAFGYESKTQMSANSLGEIPHEYDRGSVHSAREQFVGDFDGKGVKPTASAHSHSHDARCDPGHESRHVSRHDLRRDPPHLMGTTRDLMASSNTSSDTFSDTFRRSSGADSWKDASGTCWGGQLGLAELGSSVPQKKSTAERWVDSLDPMTGQAH